MLSTQRQNEEIRRHLARKFDGNAPADEAAKYSVYALPDRPGWYGIFKQCEMGGDQGHLEDGSEWWEGGIPGAVLRPSDLTPADLQRAKEAPSQFIARPKAR